jgi:hypothetical protein
MKALLLVAALSTFSTIAHAQEAEDEGCGTQELSAEAMAAIEGAAEKENDDKADDATIYKVPVFIHVIRRAPQGEGDMPVSHARAITIDVLNERFAAQDIPITFELQKIDYLNVDAATYHLEQNSAAEQKLWDDLQVRGRKNLNIYIVGPNASSNATGWAEFLVNPALRRGDHVVLRYYPDRGGFSDPLVPVHEAGHWLGLLHTFHFGCGGILKGDLIGDTPQQKQTFSCAANTDTCPGDSGVDALANIMGYSNACRAEFSPGQIKRMTFLYRTLRGGKTDETFDPNEIGPTDDMESGGCSTSSHPSLAGLFFVLLASLRLLRALGRASTVGAKSARIAR